MKPNVKTETVASGCQTGVTLVEQKPPTPIQYEKMSPSPVKKLPNSQPLIASEVTIEPAVASMLESIEEAVAKIGSAEKQLIGCENQPEIKEQKEA